MSFAMITIMLIKTNHYLEVRTSLLNCAYFALIFEPLYKAWCLNHYIKFIYQFALMFEPLIGL